MLYPQPPPPNPVPDPGTEWKRTRWLQEVLVKAGLGCGPGSPGPKSAAPFTPASEATEAAGLTCPGSLPVPALRLALAFGQVSPGVQGAWWGGLECLLWAGVLGSGWLATV